MPIIRFEAIFACLANEEEVDAVRGGSKVSLSRNRTHSTRLRCESISVISDSARHEVGQWKNKYAELSLTWLSSILEYCVKRSLFFSLFLSLSLYICTSNTPLVLRHIFRKMDSFWKLLCPCVGVSLFFFLFFSLQETKKQRRDDSSRSISYGLLHQGGWFLVSTDSKKLLENLSSMFCPSTGN